MVCVPPRRISDGAERHPCLSTLLALVEGIGEFVASILLYTNKTTPISVEIFQRMYAFEFGTACAYGVLQIVMIILVLYVSRKLTERQCRVCHLTIDFFLGVKAARTALFHYADALHSIRASRDNDTGGR